MIAAAAGGNSQAEFLQRQQQAAQLQQLQQAAQLQQQQQQHLQHLRNQQVFYSYAPELLPPHHVLSFTSFACCPAPMRLILIARKLFFYVLAPRDGGWIYERALQSS